LSACQSPIAFGLSGESRSRLEVSRVRLPQPYECSGPSAFLCCRGCTFLMLRLRARTSMRRSSNWGANARHENEVALVRRTGTRPQWRKGRASLRRWQSPPRGAVVLLGLDALVSGWPLLLRAVDGHSDQRRFCESRLSRCLRYDGLGHGFAGLVLRPIPVLFALVLRLDFDVLISGKAALALSVALWRSVGDEFVPASVGCDGLRYESVQLGLVASRIGASVLAISAKSSAFLLCARAIDTGSGAG